MRMQADSMKEVSKRRNYANVLDALYRVTVEEGFWEAVCRARTQHFAGHGDERGHARLLRSSKGDGCQVHGRPRPEESLTPNKTGIICSPVLLRQGFPRRLTLEVAAPRHEAGFKGKMPYSGVFDLAGKILTREGPLAFWTGFPAVSETSSTLLSWRLWQNLFADLEATIHPFFLPFPDIAFSLNCSTKGPAALRMP